MCVVLLTDGNGELLTHPSGSHTQANYTALIWASYNGTLDVVNALLADGVDLNAKQNVGGGAGNRPSLM